MGISLAAAHFHAVHAVAAVRVFRYCAGHNRLCKAGPSAAGIKFVSRGKKRFSCNDIHIDAWFMVIPILSCKGPFGGGILNLGIPPVLNFGPCLASGRIEAVAGELAGILGVDLPQLPVVVSAPQWLEEQALADGAFALALGFHLHLGLAPFVTGSPVIMDVLCNKMEEMTGGKLFVETEIDQAANQIEAVIMDKRRGLGFNE